MEGAEINQSLLAVRYTHMLSHLERLNIKLKTFVILVVLICKFVGGVFLA